MIVADDDRDVRTMLRTLLELDAHEVMEATDGDEAWRLCLEYQPSVVVADIQMASLDGLQLCRKIRSEEGRRTGCDEYFLKTDPLPRLRDKVRQYVSARTPPSS